jgi:alanine racemase
MLFPVEMRLKVKTGINNSILIDRAYSSSYQSLKIALDFLESQKQFTIKQSYQTYFKVVIKRRIICQGSAAYCVQSWVIGIGETITAFKHKFENCITLKIRADFLAILIVLNLPNETILIKGEHDLLNSNKLYTNLKRNA